MPRKAIRSKAEEIRADLVALLQNFAGELSKTDIRSKVRALIPAFHKLRELGASLLPGGDASGARKRLLQYLIRYPRIVIAGDELMVVAGIGEWARRIRELRVQFGWHIVTGISLREMQMEEEFDTSDLTIGEVGADDYVLLTDSQDREAALRWNIANEVRRRRASVKDKVLQFLRANVGQAITGEELRYVAKGRTEWARRVRELRTEDGWPVATRNTGRPDLPVGVYVLERDRQAPAHDRKLRDAVRRSVMRRDDYRCCTCGWTRKDWTQDDPRYFEVHHKRHHARGGSNEVDNLETLCNVCHDERHRKEGAGARA